ncbi:hypothetical protein FIV30_15150 [Lactiplantibacillus plantarum]|nr:hypothetical protein [Lactiplantibacillus plantarum]MDN7038274.1 hypothetical protein [Lactiplantibacillus plantarum]
MNFGMIVADLIILVVELIKNQQKIAVY